jgi:2-methylcitrate dehydratase
MNKTISQIWAEYAVNLTFEQIPADAVKAAKVFLYDSFGCALGGSKTEDFQILETVFADIGGKPECSVIGSSLKTDVRSASLMNGLAIRALDYNDVYWKQDPCHPSDLLPAAFCVGEREKKSGKDLIVATVIAYELEMRICEAAFPGVRELGLHHATLTQFVAPVVAGKMLGLNAEQITNAIGIAGSHSTTLGAVTAGTLTMMKNTVDPMATEAGVFAALLAQKGYKGTTPIFEGREGLFEVIGKEWKPEALTENLGQTFKIVDCSIKPFPSEALTHAPISAVLDLVFEHDIKPEDIENIEIATLKRAAEILADEKKYVIDSRETADHSLPYCIAAAVVARELTPAQFSREALANTEILATVPKVKAKLEPSFESRFPAEQPCAVEIKLKNGQVFAKERAYPKGDPRDPLTTEELKRKFAVLAEGVINGEKQEQVFQMIENLENVSNLKELMNNLVK